MSAARADICGWVSVVDYDCVNILRAELVIFVIVLIKFSALDVESYQRGRLFIVISKSVARKYLLS